MGVAVRGREKKEGVFVCRHDGVCVCVCVPGGVLWMVRPCCVGVWGEWAWVVREVVGPRGLPGGGRGCETEKTRKSPSPTDCGPALSRLTSFTPRARHSQPAHTPPPGAACLRNTHTHTHTHTPLLPKPPPSEDEKQPPPRAPPEQPTKNKMRAALPTSHASGPALAARPARPSVRAAATPSPPPRDTSSSAAPPTKSGYPDMETSAADTGLLPRREPGSFPSPTLVAAWNRLSVELLEGADTGAPPAAAGEEAAYDPLRDGPARYLGYSNECGCVFFFSDSRKDRGEGGGGVAGLAPAPGVSWRLCVCTCMWRGGSLRGSARLAPPLARGRPGIWAGGATVGRRERRQKKAARARGGRAAWPPPGRVHTPAPSAVVFGRRPGLNVAAERIAGPPSRAARPQIGVPPKKHARLGARPRAPQPAHPPKNERPSAHLTLSPLSPPSKTARPLPPGCPPLASPSPTPSPSATSSSTRWTRA